MTSLSIHLDGDGIWPDMVPEKTIRGNLVGVAALAAGMESGRGSVSFRVELPDGQLVFCETSMRLFLNAAKLFQTKYAHELEGPG